MNADIKRHIDTARQILVGVVPNPTSQIDQITNALIYKFMDDMDSAAIKQGDDPSFFINDLEPYAWTRIMDSRIGNQERMNLYGEALTKFSQSKQLPPLFREVFKSAFLPYRSPETLGLFLKEISYFDYTHPEDLGDAYEYLLSIMSSQGDAGQFRTPRHIIDFIVDIINPTKNDKILDPACGTGGFLVSAYKHILDQTTNKTENIEIKTLTPDERKKLMHNLEGYDVDPTMVRIAQVNMYLHQFKSPQIHQYNSLSEEEKWNEKFDIILANPPFMSPKGGVKPHSKFGISSNRSEVLFVDYIINHLRPKGKAGIIVPEGIIFQSGKAHKELRKNLINNGLYAVVSLPPGVFNPYSGVKTSILLIDNEISKQTNEILFIKIENDGYDLGAQRRPIHKNDLPIALEILDQWKSGQKSEHKIAQYVAKTQIAQGEDYNLSGDRYRITTDYSNAKWPMVKLKEVAVIDWGNTNITKKEYKENGSHLAVSAAGCDGRMDKYEHEVGVTVLSAIGANCGVVFYPTEKFIAIKNTMTFTPDRTKLNPRYLYLIMRDNSLPRRGGGQPFMAKGDVGEYLIPLPPLEIQEQIVAELDSYSAIINGATQITQNWKPKIDINPEWEKVKLGEVLDRVSEQIDPQKKAGEVFYVGLENIESGSGRIVGNPITKFEEIKSLKNAFQPGDLLYGKLRPNLNKVWFSDREGICSTDILVFRENKNSLANFYWYLLLSNDFVSEVMVGIKGAQLPRVGSEHLKNLTIPLPPLETQKQIVAQIEAERTLVESAKQLIQIYQQKTKATIAKLWEE